MEEFWIAASASKSGQMVSDILSRSVAKSNKEAGIGSKLRLAEKQPFGGESSYKVSRGFQLGLRRVEDLGYRALQFWLGDGEEGGGGGDLGFSIIRLRHCPFVGSPATRLVAVEHRISGR